MAPERTVQPGPASSRRVVDVALSGRLGSFSLDVHFASDSERVVLFGPSGSGKSLTLRAMAGIFSPRISRIIIKDTTLDDSNARVHVKANKRRVGYVPQGYALFPHMTVRENILYGVTELPRRERERRLGDILQIVGLSGYEERRPLNLSGGQQQRVALARALVADPLVLLLDEPFAAIDTPLRAGLRAELASIQAATGTAMITVTHDLGDAFALGDWVVVIDNGGVLQEGNKDEVYFRPATRKVAELVGIRNIVSSIVADVSEGWVVVQLEGSTLTAPTAGRRFRAGQRVDVCIRPAQLMIRRPEDDDFGDRLNVLTGLIVEEGLIAETRRLFVRLHGSRKRFDLEIDLPEYTYFRLGLDRNKNIEMHVQPERVHVLPGTEP